jgi:GGDEF domain-containing protein
MVRPLALGRLDPSPVSDRRRNGAPTPEAIEALVRAIEAKEATPGGGETSSMAVDAAVQRPRPTRARQRSAGPSIRPGPPATYRAPGSPPSPAGPIPGLIGRQAWETALAEEAERQQRYGRPLAIVIAELEGLEPVATSMGTAMIGRMAPRCAAILLALARASDRVTRLSGSRFGVLLLEADERAAELYADRAMATCESWLDASAFAMRLSIGWAVARGPEELLGALRTAEDGLRAEV